MKRFLSLSLYLISAGILFAGEPQIFPGYNFSGISPDGIYAVSFDNPSMGVMNLKTGQPVQTPKDSDYGTGAGCVISNNAIVVGSSSSTEQAGYWKEGKWQLISPDFPAKASYALGISPDGTRIVGYYQPSSYADEDFEGLMYEPCYWELQNDGTYSNPIPLPHPDVDFTNRSPQSISAVWISEDGNTIAGQVEDYMGYVYEPIIYKYNGTSWSYDMPASNLFKIVGLETPPPFPNHEPLPQDYMSPEEITAYEAALQAWENDPYAKDDEYPAFQEFMKPDKWEEFYEALDIYITQMNTFMEYYYAVVQKVPTFEKNNVLLSANGKYYASTDRKTYIDPENMVFTYIETPYLIDLETGEWTAYSNTDVNIYVTSLADDGTLLGRWTDGEAYIAYVLVPGAQKFIPLVSYIEGQNPTLAAWMKEKMFHEYEMLDPINGIYETSAIATGTPYATPDLSTIVFGIQNFWQYPDEEGYAPFYSYAINPEFASIENLPANTSKDGVYRVYNLQGVKVIECKNVESLKSLPKGIYVVNGKKILI